MENNSFEKKIAECVNEKLNDGTVERIVGEKLEEGISDAVSELFGYGGEVKKLIAGKVKDTMVPVIESHDFDQYLVKLDYILTELVNKTSLPDNKHILENFQYIMKDDVKGFEIVSMSEIYEKWKEYVAHHIDTRNLEVCVDDSPSYCPATVSMEVKENERSWFGNSLDDLIVKFTCEEDEDMNCEFSIRRYSQDEEYTISEGTIPINILSLRLMNEFEIYIQKMRRAYSRIKVDINESCEDEVEVEAEPEADWS